MGTKLRKKRIGERVTYLDHNILSSGKIKKISSNFNCELKVYLINGSWIKEEEIFFPSENLRVEVTEEGLKVTGETEPEPLKPCPWCGKNHELIYYIGNESWGIAEDKKCFLNRIRITRPNDSSISNKTEIYKEICEMKRELP